MKPLYYYENNLFLNKNDCISYLGEEEYVRAEKNEEVFIIDTLIELIDWCEDNGYALDNLYKDFGLNLKEWLYE